MKKKVTLEKCPFCGGEARLVVEDCYDHQNYNCIYVECKECEACTMYTNNEKDAVDRWNRRV